MISSLFLEWDKFNKAGLFKFRSNIHNLLSFCTVILLLLALNPAIQFGVYQLLKHHSGNIVLVMVLVIMPHVCQCIACQIYCNDCNVSHAGDSDAASHDASQPFKKEKIVDSTSVSLTQLLLGHLGTSGRHWMGGVRRPYTEWYTYVPIFSKNIFESCIVIDDTWYRHDDTRIISHLFREAWRGMTNTIIISCFHIKILRAMLYVLR